MRYKQGELETELYKDRGEVWRQEKKESSGDFWIERDIDKHRKH